MITWAVAEPSAGKMAAFAWEECPLAPITDMGALNGFYRNTQLQGHLVQDGLYLDSVPEFWTTGSDFPYRKKESDKEVFFVDEFSIARFLGGFPQQWNHGGNQLPTNDMAYLDDKGKLCYRLDLVRARLDQYIKNGYTHFTIQLGNVPWAMSRDPSKSGPYGGTEPPRDWKEWRDFIRAVCGEIKAVYPQDVLDHLRFKIGNEYNGKENFTGSYEDYLKLYDYSAAAIQEVFPKAPILPGEFAGGAGAGSNEISYVKLFDHFTSDKNRAGGTTPPPASALVRSTHSFPFARDIGPRERVRSALGSFREVLAGKPVKLKNGLSFEYHQYGVLAPGLMIKSTMSGCAPHPGSSKSCSDHGLRAISTSAGLGANPRRSPKIRTRPRTSSTASAGCIRSSTICAATMHGSWSRSSRRTPSVM
ncbi:MAG: GH39 family glycosyl hydrolase [Terrimicrobiaceae bacterium]